jgi:lysophospholipase L1-like esterase
MTQPRRHGWTIKRSLEAPSWRWLPGCCLVLLCLGLYACSSGQSIAASRSTPTPMPQVTPTPRAAVTYVAIGASDAFGIGTTVPDRDNWPTVLASELGASVHLVNLGIPGASAEVANRDEVPLALAAQPDVITVFLGVNDLDAGVALATFGAQMQTLLTTLTAETSARVFVGNLPDLSLLPHFATYDLSQLRAEVHAWNAAIATAAHSAGAVVVDLFDGWGELAKHPDYISGDGFHPSSLGAVRLAEVFAAAIRADGAGT